MNIWPFTRREHRESFTSQAINQAEQQAGATVSSLLTACIEGCAGLWERGLASVTCEHLSAAQLAVLGRQLLHHGECVFIRERGKIGAVASAVDISGKSSNPSAWSYRVTVPAPNDSRTVRKSGGDVVHVRIGATVERPWEGCSPLTNASATRAILSAVEESLYYEAGGAVGRLIPVPSRESVAGEVRPDGTRGPGLADDVKAMKGRTALVETTQSGYGDPSTRPRSDFDPKRLGPDWPPAEIEGRRDIERSVCAACGVPPLLVIGDGGAGTDAREAWRQFVFSTLQPIALLLEAELDRIGMPAPVTFDRLNASDLTGRARAYGSLVTGGMKPERAAKIAGFNG